MSEEKNDDSGDAATDLLGLFAPPTPPSKPENAKTLQRDDSASQSKILEQDEDNPGQSYQSFEAMRSYDDINRAEADIGAPPGSIGYMMGLFSAPKDKEMGTPKAPSSSSLGQSETMPLLANSQSSWNDISEATPKSGIRSRKHLEGGRVAQHIRLPSLAMPVIQEVRPTREEALLESTKGWAHWGFFQCKEIAKQAAKPTTLIGSFMYLLYHVVFCLALGSAIIRPNSSNSLLGLMTKTAALGTISSSVVYWCALASEIPALYPTADLFLAPFLANLAVKVDQALANDANDANDANVTENYNDAVFLATFGVLSAIGICFSGFLLALSGVFKLANLGSFLPFPVICGFFSAVGILTWTLAITVDTGGKTAGHILTSGDPQLILFTIIHHAPSIAVASVMKYLGPKHPFFVVLVVFATIAIFYMVLFVKGISQEEAIEMGWLWSRDELVYPRSGPGGFQGWSPPAPFGVTAQVAKGLVHWQAVADGMSTAIALGLLYVIRCSVHGAALKKNLQNLSRTVATSSTMLEEIVGSPKIPRPVGIRQRQFSEAVDIEAVMQPNAKGAATLETKAGFTVIQAKPSNIMLKAILSPYGISQFVSAAVGGFAITPSVAASSTMFSLGADGVAPQIGSVLLLLVFYFTDFQLVGYIPKPAFSSMLVLAFIDMIYTWFYKSYFKTKDKFEWMVVPAIVICAFVFDLLSAVFLGIAFSTFIFVGSFNRSGVVKYVANGAVIRSTIERPFKKGDWLMENGDFIQVLVLQNYLFFGNASGVYNYISSMFQRSDGDGPECDEFESRKPKFLILDLTLITGIDTSTVDIFNEIRNLCATNQCKLFVTGLTTSLRTVLNLGGFKPETTERSKRMLRFFANLDAALGKAEDLLLENECDDRNLSPNDHRVRLLSEGDFGFRTALRQIDEEHGDNFSTDLLGWQSRTTLVELNTGDQLYKDNDSEDIERGLFFIESGVLKIVQDTSATFTRGSTMTKTSKLSNQTFIPTTDTLSKIQAMEYSNILEASRNEEARTFRLARIGPGWIAGTLEAVSGRQRPGFHVAVTPCRLHHLPFSKIVEAEKENPAMVLSLYKLLAYMMARRQEATIGQLATLHAIMTAPAQKKVMRKVD